MLLEKSALFQKPFKSHACAALAMASIAAIQPATMVINPVYGSSVTGLLKTGQVEAAFMAASGYARSFGNIIGHKATMC